MKSQLGIIDSESLYIVVCASQVKHTFKCHNIEVKVIMFMFYQIQTNKSKSGARFAKVLTTKITTYFRRKLFSETDPRYCHNILQMDFLTLLYAQCIYMHVYVHLI